MLQISELPISTLAYIGDAVYELAIRMAILKTYQAKSGAIHKKVISLVNAAAQSAALERVEEQLNDPEKCIVKRAGNHSVPHARQVDPAEYRRATGLEALLGYLYLHGDKERILELLLIAQPDLEFEQTWL